jgi:hypothetical protein
VSEGVTEGETDDDAVSDFDTLELAVTEDEAVVDADTDMLADSVILREADRLLLTLAVTDPDSDDVTDAVIDKDNVAVRVPDVVTLTEGDCDLEFCEQPCGPTQRVQLSPELTGSQMSK